MSDAALAFFSATELAAGYRQRAFSVVEVVDNAIERANEINPVLNCFTEIYAEEALDAARACDRALAEGCPTGPLHGVPVAIKDITPIRGKRTTLGSKAFADNIATADAVVVERLRQAGVIILGHTTTAEFAYAGFTSTPLWGTTRNPWNPERTSGGSSGGSAVAVAAGCVPLAEGTDMGGSIRSPAAYCGIVGLKPSLGRIPLDFLPTQFESIAHTGPLARTVEDAALFLDVCAGSDDRDIQSLQRIREWRPVPGDVAGLRVALSLDLGFYEISGEVARNTRLAADMLRAQGAVVEEVEVGWSAEINDAWMTYWKVYLAAFYGEHLDAWRDSITPELARWMDDAADVSAIKLRRMERLRSEHWRRLAEIFSLHDALICPTTTMTAPSALMCDSDFEGAAPNGRCPGPDMTQPFNFVSQCPAISVPSGLAGDGLPTGVQLVGRRHDECTILSLGSCLRAMMPSPLTSSVLPESSSVIARAVRRQPSGS